MRELFSVLLAFKKHRAYSSLVCSLEKCLALGPDIESLGLHQSMIK